MLHLYYRPLETSIPTLLLTGRHKRLWQQHGNAISKAFEHITGSRFLHGVRCTVGIQGGPVEHYMGWSQSGDPGRKAIQLYYSDPYPSEATILRQLCHELGHRLLDQHRVDVYYHRDDYHLTRLAEINESHRQLFVFLADVVHAAFDAPTARAVIKDIEQSYLGTAEPGDEPVYGTYWLWAEQLPRQHRQELTHALFTHTVVILPERSPASGTADVGP